MMNRQTLILISSITAIFMSSCASKGKIAGSAMEAVEKRAPFDMDCDEISTQVLGDVAVYNENIAEVNIGATGCGKKASYVTRCTPGGFVGEKVDCTPHLNSIKE